MTTSRRKEKNMPTLSYPGERTQLATEQKERDRIRKSWEAAEARAGRTLAGQPPQYDGAAQSTVEVLMYELREHGVDRFKKAYTRRRLANLSAKQVRQIIERLTKLQPQYPNITEELLETLREQIK